MCKKAIRGDLAQLQQLGMLRKAGTTKGVLYHLDDARRPTFKYDALYIKRQRFWLDLKLIALSVWITVRGKWEHRGKKF